MIDLVLKGAVGANLTADDDRIRTEEDYRIRARNAAFVVRAEKMGLEAARQQLASLLTTWDRAELEEFTSETDRDWFADTRTESYLRIVIEEMLRALA